MSQADQSNGAQVSDGAALARLELKLELLSIAIHELLEEEAEPLPPARPVPALRSNNRYLRHRALVRFSVITGGIAVLVTGAVYLPPRNPVSQAVDYTVNALVQQMPGEVADPPDLGPVIIGNPDNRHQPLRPMAIVKALLPSTDAASVSGPALVPPSPPPVNEIPLVTAVPGLPATAPTSAPSTPASTEIPVVTPSTPAPSAAPTPAPAPALPPAAPPVVPQIVDVVPTPDPTPTPKDKGKDKASPVPTPTALPSEPAPSPSGVGSSPSPSPMP